jgi:hypothetical protein
VFLIIYPRTHLSLDSWLAGPEFEEYDEFEDESVDQVETVER